MPKRTKAIQLVLPIVFSASLQTGCGLFQGSLSGRSSTAASPVIAIASASSQQGSTLSFPITLSASTTRDITLNYTLTSGTAVAGTNFTGTSGSITIPAGNSSATIDVPTLEDGVDKISSDFTVKLSPPNGATLAAAATSATGTINDANVILDFSGGTLPTGVTFTRSSSAYMYNVTGTMVSVAADVPRFDYDPSTHFLRGLLSERNSSNQTLYSEDFTNAAWTKTNAGASSVVGAAPTAATTSDILIEDGTTAIHSVSQTGVPYIAFHPVVASVYAKAAGRTKIRLRVTDGSNGFFYDCDLSAAITVATSPVPAVQGTVVASGTSGSYASLSASGVAGGAGVDDGGSGWKRCWVSGVLPIADIGSVSIKMQISLMNGASESYAGDGTSGVSLWGAQYEDGLRVPTSYIVTTGTRGTARAGDSAVYTSPTAFSSQDFTASISFWRRWYEKSFDNTLSLSTYPSMFIIYNNPARTNKLGGQYSSDGTNLVSPWFVSSAYITGAESVSSQNIQGATYKFATKREGTSLSVAVNGGATITSGVSTPSTSVDTVNIGNDDSGSGGGLGGYILKFVFRPRAMSNSAMVAITN